MAAEKQKCMIIGASPILDGRVFQEFDPKDYFVICADGGYETALKLGLVPDLVVGDFDSAQKRPPASLRTLVLPVEKDVTDTMFAALKGLAKGLRDFVLLGCLGGPRFDHSLASIETLLYLRDHGAWGFLADERTKVFLLREEKLRITKLKGATVSVFPYGCPTCTVSYTGLQYPLTRGSLTVGGLLMGVSNSIVSDDAEIKVHSGTALVAVYQP
ncbi:MAG TPA: thiamine diphosphokinase [Candidatus Acutalibacter stercorigallinarum]|nr:thiamine diphosphokinase [Candidatus Acutalibacter stercorigallinarum]